MALANGREYESIKTANGSSTVRLFAPRKVQLAPCFRWKGGLARVLAAVLAVPAVPILGVLMLLIRITSRGPVIYSQLRVGRHGKTFTMYKLRTMRHDAEAVTGPVWTTHGDPRVTWLGYLLRLFHLDELPQLLNVLRGEMDLVGPRPERPEFSAVLAQQIPGYLERLAVLPGVTGLSQVNLAPDECVEGVRRKLALDLEYIETATLAMDVRMYLCTFLRMFGIRHGLAAFLLGLHRDSGDWTDADGREGQMVTPDALAHCNGNSNGNGHHVQAGNGQLRGMPINGNGQSLSAPRSRKRGKVRTD